jgi:hypothetical protein
MVSTVGEVVLRNQSEDEQRHAVDRFEKGAATLASDDGPTHPHLTPYQISFLHFFDRPWFQRAWTFQEAVLPIRVLISIGPYRISLKLLLSCIDAVGPTEIGRILFEARETDKQGAAGYETLQAIYKRDPNVLG